MAKEKTKEKNQPMLQIDDKEYNIEELAENQKMMVAHISDLNRKIDSTTFNLQQLQFGRQAFINSLKEELNKEEE
jgi:hypothetical protein